MISATVGVVLAGNGNDDMDFEFPKKGTVHEMRWESTSNTARVTLMHDGFDHFAHEGFLLSNVGTVFGNKFVIPGGLLVDAAHPVRVHIIDESGAGNTIKMHLIGA